MDSSSSIVGEPATSTRAPSPALPSPTQTHQVSGVSNVTASSTAMDTEQLAQTLPGTAASDKIVDQSSLLGSVVFLLSSGPQDHIESGDPGATFNTAVPMVPLPELEDSYFVLRDLAIEPPHWASPTPGVWSAHATVGGPTIAAMFPDNLNLELDLLLQTYTNLAESTSNNTMPPTGENSSGAPPSPNNVNGHGGPSTVIKRGK